MPVADLSDINGLQHKDNDVNVLVEQLKRVAKKYGVLKTMRIVASVLGIIRRENFMKAHGVKETHSQSFSRLPSGLVRKEPEMWNDRPIPLDHVSLWKKGNRPYFLTSEPYYMSKQDMKDLIAHCDEFGIDFQVDAESCYYPGHSIRILFKKGAITPHDALAQKYVDVRDQAAI